MADDLSSEITILSLALSIRKDIQDVATNVAKLENVPKQLEGLSDDVKGLNRKVQSLEDWRGHFEGHNLVERLVKVEDSIKNPPTDRFLSQDELADHRRQRAHRFLVRDNLPLTLIVVLPTLISVAFSIYFAIHGA